MKSFLAALALLAVPAAALVGVRALGEREREHLRLVRQGDEALARGDVEAAIESFSGAIAIRPDSMLGYLKRGEAYRRRADLGRALGDLRIASDLDPTALRPLEELADVNYALGRYGRAADRYAEYTRLDARAAPVLYKLALARYREGRPAAAVAPLRRAVALDDRLAEAHFLLGLCLIERAQLDEARSEFTAAVRLAPALLPAREALAALMGRMGRRADEVEQLEALAALETTRPDRQVALGLAFARAGRTDLGVATLRRAAERFPDHAPIFTALGRIWVDVAAATGDRVALSKAFEALHGPATGPTASSEARTLLGRALWLASDLELAERVLQQAANTFPVDPAAFVLLADVAEARGNPSLARQSVRSHLALEGDRIEPRRRAELAERVASLSLQLNELDAAVEWFNRAVGQAPADAALLLRLAEAAWLAGDRAVAASSLERAAALAPSSLAVRRLRARLR
jgi:tetratricopeptide (TPR) repeat protein